MEKKFNVEVEGISPLLQHRFAVEEDTAALTKGKKVYNSEEDARKALYTDEKGNPIQPSTHFEGAMVKSAVQFKMQGKKTYKDAFRAGVFIEPVNIPHKIKDWEIDLMPVVVNRSRIMRSRPKFNNWKLAFQITCIDERIAPEVIKEILEDAGKFVGIGDFRPKFGRFKVIKFQEVRSN